MTAEQFAALASLMRLGGQSEARAMARLMLVEGLSPQEAAEKRGQPVRAAKQALARCNTALALCQRVIQTK